MKITNRIASCLAAVVLAGTTVLTGCHVENHKNGAHDDVNIATPFGGMSVKTGEQAAQQGMGVAVYPGATLVKKDKDDNAADVNMSFGSFHLGVKAVSYRTTDSPEKVIAFYRKELSKYGEVVLCHDKQAVGAPAETQDGLGCKDDGSNAHVHMDDDGSAGELKAGSKQHQHLVPLDREGSGTKFGLVALDLPSNLGNGKGGSTD